MRDDEAAAGGTGHRCRAGESFQRSRIGESGTAVADLGQQSGAGLGCDAGKAGDDLVVRVLSERRLDCRRQVVDGLALRGERGEQPQGLDAHRLLDERILT
ncbi:hypothetical protein AAFH96_22905 [Polymorphospora sp. 2-325]|uniref:Uncharacterized protein n=1 Tax=Polymorphospora lycopeni TaxID=3140240 RepID=A0ABV5CVA4_9ACTN